MTSSAMYDGSRSLGKPGYPARRNREIDCVEYVLAARDRRPGRVCPGCAGQVQPSVEDRISGDVRRAGIRQKTSARRVGTQGESPQVIYAALSAVGVKKAGAADREETISLDIRSRRGIKPLVGVHPEHKRRDLIRVVIGGVGCQ